MKLPAKPFRQAPLLGVIAMLLSLLSGCGGGGGGGGDETLPPEATESPTFVPNPGIALTAFLNLVGGNGGLAGGSGGHGGRFTLAYELSSGGDLDLSSDTGYASDFFTTSSVAALGTRAYSLGAAASPGTTSAHAAIVTVEPAVGTPYLMFGDPLLYLSDGDGTAGGVGDQVTGLHIEAGYTLTLELNDAGAAARIVLPMDAWIDGVLTVGDTASGMRGDLNLGCRNFQGSGTLSTRGTVAAPGGGGVELKATASIYLAGAVEAHGATAAVGLAGAGGVVTLAAASDLEVSGPLYAAGGAHTGVGTGAAGGAIDLTGGTSLRFSSVLDVRGGHGLQGGGAGGEVRLDLRDGGVFQGVGPVLAFGGDGGFLGNGGDGGLLSVHSEGTTFLTESPSSVAGGATASLVGDGGRGGQILFDVVCLAGANGALDFLGSLSVQGGAVTGGAVAIGSGGDAGVVEIYGDCQESPLGQPMRLRGLQSVVANGGTGRQAGDGGSVVLRNESARGHGGDVLPHGGVRLGSFPLQVRGGDQSDEDIAGHGGRGGVVDIDMGRGAPAAPGLLAAGVTSGATLDVSGGDSINTVLRYHDAGWVYLYGTTGFTNRGAIQAMGGNDSGSDGGVDGLGGAGGEVVLEAETGLGTQLAAIDVRGGQGEFLGGEGAQGPFGGRVLLRAGAGARLLSTGGIDASGGDGDQGVAGSRGGDGGHVALQAADGSGAIVRTGAFGISGGDGATVGSVGTVSIGP